MLITCRHDRSPCSSCAMVKMNLSNTLNHRQHDLYQYFVSKQRTKQRHCAIPNDSSFYTPKNDFDKREKKKLLNERQTAWWIYTTQTYWKQMLATYKFVVMLHYFKKIVMASTKSLLIFSLCWNALHIFFNSKLVI